MKIDSFFRKGSTLFTRLGRTLVSPPAATCLYCGQAKRAAESNLSLCRRCLANVPWITNVLCPVCGRYEDCPDCRRAHRRYFVCSRSAVEYNDGMKDMLARYKYRGDEKLAQVLGTMMSHAYVKLREAAPERQPPDSHSPRETLGSTLPPFDCITFVPVSEARLADRGFNQAEQLARVIGSIAGLHVLPLLKRTRPTSKQSFKTRAERIADMRGVFAFDEQMGGTFVDSLERRQPGMPLRIVIVDDVYTTGSTLNQCSAVLAERLSAEVYGLTWAR